MVGLLGMVGVIWDVSQGGLNILGGWTGWNVLGCLGALTGWRG